MTRNEAEASELKAARQVVMKANYKADVVQRQLGDLQKQVTGMQDRMNRMEALLQGIVKSQMRAPEQTLGRGAPKLRQAEEPSNRQDLAQLGELEVEMARRIEDMVQININSTHGVHLNGTPEGNFNSPSTGYSAVSNGWGQNQLPHTFLVSPTLNKLNPSHGSELTRQCPQYPRDYLNQPQFQYQVRQWNPNPSNDMVHSFYKTIAKGPKLDFPRFDGGEPLEWIRQSETYFATANVTDEAKFDLAQLYIVGRANRWLRRTGLLWKPPPWPDFCAMICDRFAQHSGYEVLVNFHSVKQYNISLDKAFEFNDYCRSHQPPISFIKAEVCGLFGSVFCDFGPEFTVLDVDGEDPHTGIIASISNDNPAMVSCVDDERLEFQDGDLVVFSEVQGMTELNDGKQRKIINARPYSFCIQEDTSNFGIYTKGGIVTQVKEPMILEFKSMRDSIRQPGNFLLSDFSKYERPPLLHFAFLALDKFRKEFGRFPGAGCDQDAQRFLEFAASINEAATDYKMDELDEKLLRLFASGSRAVLNPMAAMFGGIVGQEVMKACSGKFHPHYQFFYFDSVESLPTYPLDPKDLKPLNSRYDAQISVFGSKLQKKMRDTNVFVVGSGALGCEFLKNLALMGVSCGHKGTLTITDDDVIEKSNLSRQFLFRDWNIGQAKSTVAAAAASAINSSLHIDALQNRACPETEHVFPDAFWEDLDVVINALDNVNARMYMDMRCLYFQKPLLESGTLGAKCNTQMVIPHLTENYGASRDPPEKQAPMCTVHSFPHNIDHCLTWARSEFEGLLEKTPNEVNSFMSNPAQYAAAMRKAGDAQSRELLQRVCECLDKERCERFEDCITWARLKFEDYFANRVKQLTFTFPEDAATSTGALFWSAPKRFPHPLQFSAVDSSHIHFILAASILRAVSFGIPIPDWAKNTSDLVDTVSKVVVPEFEPKRGVKIETDEKATNLSSASVDDAAVIEDLLTKLEACAKKLPPGFQMKPIQFEKDDDTNFHMDLIAGLANMRARNYGIQEVDKLKAKFIAGRIIPAIATSTAMATGLVCLELYKVLAGGHPVEDYRNTFANLALPMLTMAEPLPPKVIKHQDMRWTAWDRWSIEGNITIAELLKWLSDKGLSAYSVSCGTSLLYNTMFTRHKDRLNKKIVDVAKEVAKLDVPAYRRHLDVVVACEDDDGNDIDIPLISIYFR